MAIVDQYYPEIYAFLTQNLNSNAICQMAGLCPAPGKAVFVSRIINLAAYHNISIFSQLVLNSRFEEFNTHLLLQIYF